jgi:hypothetical protein
MVGHSKNAHQQVKAFFSMSSLFPLVPAEDDDIAS